MALGHSFDVSSGTFYEFSSIRVLMRKKVLRARLLVNNAFVVHFSLNKFLS